MKKFLCILSLFILAIVFAGCTEQQRAKRYGGSATIQLPVGTALEMVTWKNADLWLLYKARPNNQPPERYIFKENSSWGVMEGRILIQER